MRVGVILGDFIPQDGGGFTFVSEVLQALASRIGSVVDIEFVLFCDERAVAYLTPSFGERNVVGVPRGFWAVRLLVRARQWWPLVGSVRWQRSALDEALNHHGIDLAWFVGGSGVPLDVPYIATVWDVQHRTHPWFPEVSAGGVWDGREVLFSTYLRRASIVITGTRVGAEQLARYYQIDTERFAILPHPTPEFAIVAAEAADVVLPAGYDESSRFFFYPAQYWPHKNHAGLIRAFATLCSDRGDAPDLVFVGSDKGNRTFLEKLAAELGVSGRVRFLGFVARNELVALYRRCIAMVYPSFSGPENLPPLEAFALGCPVIYAEFPGAREQLGDAAIYFDPQSETGIFSALTLVLDNPDIRGTLIERGRARADAWRCGDYVSGVIQAIRDFSPILSAWGRA